MSWELKEKIRQLEFKLSMIDTSRRDLIHQVELLNNDKKILREALIEAQIKLGKDTKPNFIDAALKITK